MRKPRTIDESGVGINTLIKDFNNENREILLFLLRR